MNKLLLGLAIGAIGVCVYKKLNDEGYFEGCCDDTNKFLSKSRKKIKNVMDAGGNEADYLKDRAEDMIDKGKDKLDDFTK